jgi:hypothetical protein
MLVILFQPQLTIDWCYCILVGLPILTGETPFEVRNAVEATMTEVQQVLNNSPRFEIIRSTERLRGGLFAQTMPEPLPWQLVEELCQRFDADAVLALERFSSDFVITDKKKVIKKSVGTGSEAKTIEVEGVYLEGLASVSAGFRMYEYFCFQVQFYLPAQSAGYGEEYLFLQGLIYSG